MSKKIYGVPVATPYNPDKLGNELVSKGDLLNLIYPVGSIYISANNASPSTFLGGTWSRIQDRFLLASGSAYSAGATGGSATHYHTLSDGAIALMNHHDGKFWFVEKDGVSYTATGSGASTGANVSANQTSGVPLRGSVDVAAQCHPIWRCMCGNE